MALVEERQAWSPHVWDEPHNGCGAVMFEVAGLHAWDETSAVPHERLTSGARFCIRRSPFLAGQSHTIPVLGET